MDDIKIITVYSIIEDIMRSVGHKSHHNAQVTDAEVLTIAVVAAMYFQNHHERTLFVMKTMRYITKPISISRFSRRVHTLAAAGWLEYMLEVLGQAFTAGEAFIIDSIPVPVPVCKYVRARRCRKINGSLPWARAYFGRCAAKSWRFFGWRLHLLCTPAGIPVAFQMLPGSWHDLTPIYELTFGLPKGAAVYAEC